MPQKRGYQGKVGADAADIIAATLNHGIGKDELIRHSREKNMSIRERDRTRNQNI